MLFVASTRGVPPKFTRFVLFRPTKQRSFNLLSVLHLVAEPFTRCWDKGVYGEHFLCSVQFVSERKKEHGKFTDIYYDVRQLLVNTFPTFFSVLFVSTHSVACFRLSQPLSFHLDMNICILNTLCYFDCFWCLVYIRLLKMK